MVTQPFISIIRKQYTFIIKKLTYISNNIYKIDYTNKIFYNINNK